MSSARYLYTYNETEGIAYPVAALIFHPSKRPTFTSSLLVVVIYPNLLYYILKIIPNKLY